jgi:hypothetical protein
MPVAVGAARPALHGLAGSGEAVRREGRLYPGAHGVQIDTDRGQRVPVQVGEQGAATPSPTRRTISSSTCSAVRPSIRTIEEDVRAGADDVIIMAMAPGARAGADRAAGLLGRLRNLG